MRQRRSTRDGRRHTTRAALLATLSLPPFSAQVDEWNHVRELLDTLPELRVLETVVRGHLVGGDTVDVEDLDDGAREAALRRGRGTLHEDDERGSLDGLREGRWWAKRCQEGETGRRNGDARRWREWVDRKKGTRSVSPKTRMSKGEDA